MPRARATSIAALARAVCRDPRLFDPRQDLGRAITRLAESPGAEEWRLWCKWHGPIGYEDREPDFDLVQPRGMGRGEVKVKVGVWGQPAVVFGLVGVQVVQDDVNVPAGAFIAAGYHIR
jgi:hypothetical protein